MGVPGQLFGPSECVELDGERWRRTIYTGLGPRDRVIALRPVGVSLLRWIIVYVLFVIGVRLASLYIGREGKAAVLVLVGLQLRVLVFITEAYSFLESD